MTSRTSRALLGFLPFLFACQGGTLTAVPGEQVCCEPADAGTPPVDAGPPPAPTCGVEPAAMTEACVATLGAPTLLGADVVVGEGGKVSVSVGPDEQLAITEEGASFLGPVWGESFRAQPALTVKGTWEITPARSTYLVDPNSDTVAAHLPALAGLDGWRVTVKLLGVGVVDIQAVQGEQVEGSQSFVMPSSPLGLRAVTLEATNAGWYVVASHAW